MSFNNSSETNLKYYMIFKFKIKLDVYQYLNNKSKHKIHKLFIKKETLINITFSY